MKKAVLVLMTIFIIVTGFSQTEKGKKFIGGRIFLNGSSSSSSDTLFKNGTNTFAIQIVPNYGYFIKDNLAIGANINFGINNSSSYWEYPNTNFKESFKSNSNSYGIGGFARYYKKITDNFLFFINGGVSYSYGTGRKEQITYSFPTGPPIQEIQTNTISFVGYPGLVYFITPKLGIEGSISSFNYNFSSSKNKTLLNDNLTKSSAYGINLNPISFGLCYYFQRKAEIEQ